MKFWTWQQLFLWNIVFPPKYDIHGWQKLSVFVVCLFVFAFCFIFASSENPKRLEILLIYENVDQESDLCLGMRWIKATEKGLMNHSSDFPLGFIRKSQRLLFWWEMAIGNGYPVSWRSYCISRNLKGTRFFWYSDDILSPSNWYLSYMLRNFNAKKYLKNASMYLLSGNPKYGDHKYLLSNSEAQI